MIERFLVAVMVICILGMAGIAVTPVLNAYQDNAAANRATAEAARFQAEAAKIDATGDLINSAALAAVAVGAICLNSLTLAAVVAILFMIAKRDLAEQEEKSYG